MGSPRGLVGRETPERLRGREDLDVDVAVEAGREHQLEDAVRPRHALARQQAARRARLELVGDVQARDAGPVAVRCRPRGSACPRRGRCRPSRRRRRARPRRAARSPRRSSRGTTTRATRTRASARARGGPPPSAQRPRSAASRRPRSRRPAPGRAPPRAGQAEHGRRRVLREAPHARAQGLDALGRIRRALHARDRERQDRRDRRNAVRDAEAVPLEQQRVLSHRPARA